MCLLKGITHYHIYMCIHKIASFILHCSQLRYDRYETAVESITSHGRVDEMPNKPATELLFNLTKPLLIGKVDKGKSAAQGWEMYKRGLVHVVWELLVQWEDKDKRFVKQFYYYFK